MILGKEALKTTLRVLTAISDHREPSPADVEALRRYAPGLSEAPIDEVVCDVIQHALRRRASVRARTIGPS